MTHVTRQTFHELSVLLASGQRLIDSLTEKTRPLNHLLLAFACLTLSVHYDLPHNTYPTLQAA